MIEERHPRLEARGHRHLVHAVQQRRQVGAQVEPPQPRQQVAPPDLRVARERVAVLVGRFGAAAGQQAAHERPLDERAVVDRDVRGGQRHEIAELAHAAQRRGVGKQLEQRPPETRDEHRGRVDLGDVVARVAGEQLVGALAGQHHRDVPAGEFGNQVNRNGVGVIQRFVVVPDDFG